MLEKRYFLVVAVYANPDKNKLPRMRDGCLIERLNVETLVVTITDVDTASNPPPHSRC